MRQLLTNWNAMRVLRLVLGLVVIVQGFSNREALYFVLGGLLVLMALAGAGCCGAGACTVDRRRTAVKEEKEIVYEEVDAPK